MDKGLIIEKENTTTDPTYIGSFIGFSVDWLPKSISRRDNSTEIFKKIGEDLFKVKHIVFTSPITPCLFEFLDELLKEKGDKNPMFNLLNKIELHLVFKDVPFEGHNCISGRKQIRKFLEILEFRLKIPIGAPPTNQRWFKNIMKIQA